MFKQTLKLTPELQVRQSLRAVLKELKNLELAFDVVVVSSNGGELFPVIPSCLLLTIQKVIMRISVLVNHNLKVLY